MFRVARRVIWKGGGKNIAYRTQGVRFTGILRQIAAFRPAWIETHAGWTVSCVAVLLRRMLQGLERMLVGLFAVGGRGGGVAVGLVMFAVDQLVRGFLMMVLCRGVVCGGGQMAGCGLVGRCDDICHDVVSSGCYVPPRDRDEPRQRHSFGNYPCAIPHRDAHNAALFPPNALWHSIGPRFRVVSAADFLMLQRDLVVNGVRVSAGFRPHL